METSVQAVATTWSGDQDDLFDFEAAHERLQTRTFAVSEPKVCVRTGSNVEMIAEGDESLEPPLRASLPSSLRPYSPLLRVRRKRDQFYVDKVSHSSSSRKLWLSTRDPTRPKAYGRPIHLTEGDVMKLGRSKLCLRQLGLEDCEAENLKLGTDNDNLCGLCVDMESSDSKAKSCRICFGNHSEESDPLIAPCQCKGSIEYVHLSCCRRWMHERIGFQQTRSGCSFSLPFVCELCKAPSALFVKDGSKTVSVLGLPHIKAPFVVLESTWQDVQKREVQRLHILSLAQHRIHVGRGFEADVQIKYDHSISRRHAAIGFSNGSCYLEDLSSKFGSFVLLKRQRQLQENQSFSLQVGRTILTFNTVTASSVQPPVSGVIENDEKWENLSTRSGTSNGTASTSSSQSTGGGTFISDIFNVTMPWAFCGSECRSQSTLVYDKFDVTMP